MRKFSLFHPKYNARHMPLRIGGRSRAPLSAPEAPCATVRSRMLTCEHLLGGMGGYVHTIFTRYSHDIHRLF